MKINQITLTDLRRMNGKEGLVLQGCGGDPQEWLDGINSLLTDEGILKNGSRFENISVFQNGELTNILFPFEDGLEIDMGKLAMWRLRSHERIGSVALFPNMSRIRQSPIAGSSARTETSSTLWGLPPVHSDTTVLRNRQRK